MLVRCSLHQWPADQCAHTANIMCRKGSRWVIDWKAGMDWEKMKVDYDKSVLVVFCFCRCLGKEGLGQSGPVVFALLLGITLFLA